MAISGALFKLSKQNPKDAVEYLEQGNDTVHKMKKLISTELQADQEEMQLCTKELHLYKNARFSTHKKLNSTAQTPGGNEYTDSSR